MPDAHGYKDPTSTVRNQDDKQKKLSLWLKESRKKVL